jgi:hypothetical protein
MFKTFILNFLFHPQENATHNNIDILGIPRNIPSNTVDEQFGKIGR